MSEVDATSTTESTANQTAEGSATPGSTEGSGGTQTAPDSFAAERTQLEARSREWQGRFDKAEARNRELESRLAALEGNGNGGGSTTPAPAFDANAVVSELEARMAFREEMRTTAAALKDEYPYANADLFGKATEFDSPEALRAAVENSHNSVKGVVDAAVSEREQALIAEVAAKYGVQISTTPVDNGQTPSGDPSINDLAAMTQAELDRLEADNPGVIDRVLRSAN